MNVHERRVQADPAFEEQVDSQFHNIVEIHLPHLQTNSHVKTVKLEQFEATVT